MILQSQRELISGTPAANVRKRSQKKRKKETFRKTRGKAGRRMNSDTTNRRTESDRNGLPRAVYHSRISKGVLFISARLSPCSLLSSPRPTEPTLYSTAILALFPPSSKLPTSIRPTRSAEVQQISVGFILPPPSLPDLHA